MKMFRFLAATALLIPCVPATAAMAQPPTSDSSFCLVFGGMEICYFETRAQCQYSRAKEANAFRDEQLTVDQCTPSDDPLGLGAQWEFFATFF
jgi:hypothetical protein